MNSPAEVHEIGLAARRPDGSEVRAADVVTYLASVRVAAGVIDGRRLGQPALHTVRMALTPDGLVVRSDGLPATLDWQGLVRSLVHRFETVAVVDDGVLGPDGRHHDEDLPDELEDLLDGMLGVEPGEAVHALRFDPDADIDAELIASSAEAPVERSRIDGFVLVRETAASLPAAKVSLALKSQLPALSLHRTGDATEAVVRLRDGRRVVEVTVSAPVAPTLPEGLGPDLRDLLTGRNRLSWSGRPPPDDLIEQFGAAGTGETSFAHDVAMIAGGPAAAAAWLEQARAPGPVEVVEARSTRELLARGAREIGAGVRDDFSREALTKGPLGGFRRLLLDHPLVTLLYGIAELAVAYVLVTAFEPWAVVRWVAAGLVALDGLTSVAIATVTLRRGARR